MWRCTSLSASDALPFCPPSGCVTRNCNRRQLTIVITRLPRFDFPPISPCASQTRSLDWSNGHGHVVTRRQISVRDIILHKKKPQCGRAREAGLTFRGVNFRGQTPRRLHRVVVCGMGRPAQAVACGLGESSTDNRRPSFLSCTCGNGAARVTVCVCILFGCVATPTGDLRTARVCVPADSFCHFFYSISTKRPAIGGHLTAAHK